MTICLIPLYPIILIAGTLLLIIFLDTWQAKTTSMIFLYTFLYLIARLLNNEINQQSIPFFTRKNHHSNLKSLGNDFNFFIFSLKTIVLLIESIIDSLYAYTLILGTIFCIIHFNPWPVKFIAIAVLYSVLFFFEKIKNMTFKR